MSKKKKDEDEDVFYVKSASHEYKVSQKPLFLREGTAGTCRTQALEIEIDDAIPVSAQEEALVHEIIEAINYHYELELEHNKITVLGAALHQVLAENPHLTFGQQ